MECCHQLTFNERVTIETTKASAELTFDHTGNYYKLMMNILFFGSNDEHMK